MLKVIRRSRNLRIGLLVFPGAFWLTVFFLAPLGVILVYSFLRRGPRGGVRWIFTTYNYIRMIDFIYLRIFLRSVGIALLTTIFCLIVGYPLAYFIARHRNEKWRNALLLLVVVPFWTNFLVRTYAWIVILRTEGVLNIFLQSLGIIQEPLQLLYTLFAVILGLVYGYLPFMVLPLYASIEKFDFSLMEAAYDLGADDRRAFLRVMLPLTAPGIIAGCILVFIPALGAFITPDILGGAKVMMIGNLIQNQFLKARHWPFGSSLSIILMLIVVSAVVIYFRMTEERAI